MKKIIFGSILFFSINLLAQLPESFTKIARNTHYGWAEDVLAINDSTVIAAQNHGGIVAFRFNGQSFAPIAHIDSGGSVVCLEPVNDTLFLAASGSDGLRAFVFNNNTFSPYAHINEDYWALKVLYDTSGLIFLSCESEGLYVYTLSDSAFNFVAHTDMRGSTKGVAYSADSIVFMAHGSGGMSAYKLTGSIFSQLAWTADYGDHIHIFSDSILLVENTYSLYAYKFDGSTLTEITHTPVGVQDIEIIRDSVCLLATGTVGVYAYSFNGSEFTWMQDIMNGGLAKNIDMIGDSLLFLANYDDFRAYSFSEDNNFSHLGFSYAQGQACATIAGLDSIIHLANYTDGIRVYQLENNKLVCYDHKHIGGAPHAIVSGSTENVFTTTMSDGWWAYSFTGVSSTNALHYTNDGDPFTIAATSDNYVLASYGYDGVQAYNYNGSLISKTDLLSISGKMNDIEIDANNLIYMPNSLGGTYVYKIENEKFDSVNYFDIDAEIFALGPNSVLYAIKSHGYKQNSLSAYYYAWDGGIQKIARIDNVGEVVEDITVNSNGTIFLALKYDGLAAYEIMSDTFLLKAQVIEDGSWAKGVTAGLGNLVYLSDYHEGLIIYDYSGHGSSTLGIQSNVYSDFNIYPTIAADFINIELNNIKPKFVRITIVDLTGQKVFETRVFEFNNMSLLNVSSLQKGLYLISISDNGRLLGSKKFLKK